MSSEAIDRTAQRIMEVLTKHQFYDPAGGTATGSRSTCTCGEVLFTWGDREYVHRLGLRHIADEIQKELGLLPATTNTRPPQPDADAIEKEK